MPVKLKVIVLISILFFILNSCLGELLAGVILQALGQPKRGLHRWISLVI